MNCDEIRELLSDYRDGVLEADRNDAVKAHIEGCEGCRKELADLEFTLKALGALKHERVPHALKQRVLLGAKEVHLTQMVSRSEVQAPPRAWRVPMLARVAAVLFVGVLAVLFWHSHVGEEVSDRAAAPEAAKAGEARAADRAERALVPAPRPVAAAPPAEESLDEITVADMAPAEEPVVTMEKRRDLARPETAAKAGAMKMADADDQAVLGFAAGAEADEALAGGGNQVMIAEAESEEAVARQRDVAVLRDEEHGAGDGAAFKRKESAEAAKKGDMLHARKGLAEPVQVFRIPAAARRQTEEFVAQLLVGPPAADKDAAPAASALAAGRVAKQEERSNVEADDVAQDISRDAGPADASGDAPAEAKTQISVLDQVIILTRTQFAQLTAYLEDVRAEQIAPARAAAVEVEAKGADVARDAVPDGAGEGAAAAGEIGQTAAEEGTQTRARLMERKAAEPADFFDLQIQLEAE